MYTDSQKKAVLERYLSFFTDQNSRNLQADSTGRTPDNNFKLWLTENWPETQVFVFFDTSFYLHISFKNKTRS